MEQGQFKRKRAISFWVSEAERELIKKTGRQLDFTSTSQFLRHIVFDFMERLALQDENTPRLF